MRYVSRDTLIGSIVVLLCICAGLVMIILCLLFPAV